MTGYNDLMVTKKTKSPTRVTAKRAYTRACEFIAYNISGDFEAVGEEHICVVLIEEAFGISAKKVCRDIQKLIDQEDAK